jgi:hypothetical protein
MKNHYKTERQSYHLSASHDVKEHNVPEQTLQESEIRCRLLADVAFELFPIHQTA